jgi:hypothetical protein
VLKNYPPYPRIELSLDQTPDELKPALFLSVRHFAEPVLPQAIFADKPGFQIAEAKACELAAKLGYPIVYTQPYLALKNAVISQELSCLNT